MDSLLDFENDESLENTPPQLTESELIIDELFGILPDEIKMELVEFIDSYKYERVRWNIFAVTFNQILWSAVARMLNGGDSNSNFLNIPTRYQEYKEFWSECEQMAFRLYPYTTDITLTNFVHIVRRMLQVDGFNVAHQVNTRILNRD